MKFFFNFQRALDCGPDRKLCQPATHCDITRSKLKRFILVPLNGGRELNGGVYVFNELTMSVQSLE